MSTWSDTERLERPLLEASGHGGLTGYMPWASGTPAIFLLTTGEPVPCVVHSLRCFSQEKWTSGGGDSLTPLWAPKASAPHLV